ncbi:hypothetical protein RJ639_036135 [Escallonia herrerae]|uniref:BRCT domain-containing protein n=1 Tax=Escallonia herrerae TaxID=1293975 RepID=A0AA89B8I3_9ASTE|nr:hypothetical protein RJ639_036135 [Escallonia herrerae]
MAGGGGRVKVINTKGCSRLFGEITNSSLASFRALRPDPTPIMSPCSQQQLGELFPSTAAGPFSGLVICVTGLSKEARQQVMDATERLGGQYSPHLHPQCTHLVVQISFSLSLVIILQINFLNTLYSSGGRKYEHALKHGSKNGLLLVTLGWFVDSVRRNLRLSETLYSVKSAGETGMPVDDLNRLLLLSGTPSSCLPSGMLEHLKQSNMIEGPQARSSGREIGRNLEANLAGHSLYIDVDVPAELRSKVVEAASREGATLVDQWFFGRNISHVVCEGPSVRKYLGYSSNIVTPLWVVKTAKELHLRRLVHISADLARQLGTMLDNVQNGNYGQVDSHHPLSYLDDNGSRDASNVRIKASHEERQKIAKLAKDGVRKRRSRYMQFQKCHTPILPITSGSLLETICWSISEPTSSASLYTHSFSSGDTSEHHTSIFFDAKGDEKDSDTSFVNLSRPLTESEKTELILRNHYLTILFPLDRFAEMGPCSRTFFSNTGFTCLQVLDFVYAFYQENMSAEEIELAIHTDSRHADRVRLLYSCKDTLERGFLEFKRIDFLGSRRSFEMLKRVSGDNNSNVYELLIRA